jgi:hypothetical protein
MTPSSEKTDKVDGGNDEEQVSSSGTEYLALDVPDLPSVMDDVD